ncbi:MBL fold metallo-hydrolase [Nocardia puris]|uniref:Glyoxylase-like metal-dependent hydrolase (Beta-lactamase superfamily II) n=1 Tax=Nocardia puris TaxID=208602 RepID=A0A366D5S0_9NOCA|nr:MBL fold metallo-hydrolase [Nocardia puris]RBO85306.1 glyoxylase-like metal-dependent hydrolase (beta-lactamase superfamily II) [Nocardia puris]
MAQLSHSATTQFTRPGAQRSIFIGDLRVTYLPDGVGLLNPGMWLPGASEDLWIDHAHLLNPDGWLTASLGALLIEHGDRAMLIDTGFGPLSVPTDVGTLHGGGLLDSLAAAGKNPADIELIAVTHLHLDHIGWLCLTPEPGPFAHTRVVVGETEWARPDLAIADGTAQVFLDRFSRQVTTITAGEEIFPGVRAIALPGHSLGHTGYLVTSRGQRLAAIGDALTTPLQVTHPDLTAAPDDDPIASRRTAARLIDDLAAPGTLGFAVHFADAQFGHITHHTTDGYRWNPHAPGLR